MLAAEDHDLGNELSPQPVILEGPLYHRLNHLRPLGELTRGTTDKQKKAASDRPPLLPPAGRIILSCRSQPAYSSDVGRRAQFFPFSLATDSTSLT